MKQPLIVQAMTDVTRSVRFIAFLGGALTTGLYMLLFLLAASILSLPWYAAAVVAVPLGLVKVVSRLRHANVYLVENTLPEFKDRLTAVRDSLGMQNEVVRALHQETITKLKTIKNSYFIQFGRLASKIFSMGVLSFVIVSLAAFNVRFSAEDNVRRLLSVVQPYAINQSLLQYKENTTDDIYGNASVATLGYDELKLQIQPLETDINIKDIREVEQKSFRDNRAKEIAASNDGTYDDDVPKEHRKIIAAYFSEIAKQD